jgi:ATP-dependent RNA helicase RhlE
VSLEQLKLNKQLESAMEESGFSFPKELQEKAISRIKGGQDMIGVGPEGSGKTTTVVLGILAKIKWGHEAAPRALVLVPNRDAVKALVEKFEFFVQKSELVIVGLEPGHSMEGQKNALYEGADIVVSTPDRILSIYFKSGINLNKIKLFVLDDADQLVRGGFQPQIHQLVDSLPKCQHLAFSEVMHSKLDRLLGHFMNYPVIIEVTEASEESIEVIDQILYQVPNFRSKLNLLKFLLDEEEEETKTVIFANTRITVEHIYSKFEKRLGESMALLKPEGSLYNHFRNLNDFLSSEAKILVVANEDIKLNESDWHSFSNILHFDLPDEKDLFINRVRYKEDEAGEARLSIIFANDLELNQVKKIEHAIGHAIHIEDLPEDVVVDPDHREKKKKTDEEEAFEERGSAFHDKKSKNAKQKNYTYFDRLKMFGKKNRPNKKGDKS